MDELQMIATMLDEPPAEGAAARGRVRVQHEIRSPGRPTRPRRVLRMPRPVFGGIGLAAVAAVAAGAVALSSGTTPRAPSHPGTSPDSARSVLLAAATKVDGAPSGHGRYWSSVTREGGYVLTDTGQYYSVREMGRWDAGPGKDAWVAERAISSRRVGPAPSGGPAPVGDPAPTSSGGPAPAPTSSGGPAPAPTSSASPRPTGERGTGRWTKSKVKGGEAFRIADWEGTTPPDVRKLPADPHALRRFLSRTLPDHADPAEWLMSNAQKIGAAPVRPGVRAAMYRLLAGTPGLRPLGDVTDPLGRHGEGVARRITADGTVLDERLVIDPATGRLLAQESVLVKPGKAWTGRKPGTVVSYDALVSYGWTDKVPAYPVEKAG